MSLIAVLAARKEIVITKISLDVGEVLLGPDGLTAKLNGEFRGFSRCYPWKYVPKAMAMAMVLNLGEPMSAFEGILTKARMFTGKSKEAIDETFLGLIDDLTVLVARMGDIVSACPAGDTKEELKRVRAMSASDLGRYLVGRVAEA